MCTDARRSFFSALRPGAGWGAGPHSPPPGPRPKETPTAPPDLGHPPARVNLARGAEIFGGPQGCANCHGIGGEGAGPPASRFTPPLPPLTPPPTPPRPTNKHRFFRTAKCNRTPLAP